MDFSTAISPHIKPRNRVDKMMLQVLLALIPGALAMIWFFGWGILFNLLVASATAIACEALILKLRNKPVRSTLCDLSALLTGILLALALPPLAPWWLAFVGTAFAIIIAKQLYGGLGYNPFNPAMIGYVVLLISFPQQMTAWIPPSTIAATPSFLESLQLLLGLIPESLNIDAMTMATPLDTMKTELGINRTTGEIMDNELFGTFGGTGWEWIANAYLLGGIWLIYKRVISWHIPVALLFGLTAISFIFFLTGPDSHPYPFFHLFSGAIMLGAFFIATDPVTASTTPKGRLIYGFLIGLLIYIIRSYGGYPDAVAFAVLIMNLTVPLIDYYTQPRVFGHASENNHEQ
ncbi:MAG: electron transport complex subunit RsxD [Gammaproteobacteria bacterium]|nr:MAG: electron transport complex subunit RsxD [Gammaproteobacteria bacterium]